MNRFPVLLLIERLFRSSYRLLHSFPAQARFVQVSVNKETASSGVVDKESNKEYRWEEKAPKRLGYP